MNWSDIKKHIRQIRENMQAAISSHPSDSELYEYFSENLTEARMEKIRSHVSICDQCGDKVIEIQSRSN